MNSYDVGNLVEVDAEFEDLEGGPINPNDVICLVQDPAGDETVIDTADLGNPEVGRWTHEIDLDQSGIWYYRFNGADTPQAAKEGWLYVKRSQFYPAAPGS